MTPTLSLTGMQIHNQIPPRDQTVITDITILMVKYETMNMDIMLLWFMTLQPLQLCSEQRWVSNLFQIENPTSNPNQTSLQSWFEIPCMHSWFYNDWECKINGRFQIFYQIISQTNFYVQDCKNSQLKLPNLKKNRTNLLFLFSEEMVWNTWTWCI